MSSSLPVAVVVVRKITTLAVVVAAEPVAIAPLISLALPMALPTP